MKFTTWDFFSKYDQIRSFFADLTTFSEEIICENIFCAVTVQVNR